MGKKAWLMTEEEAVRILRDMYQNAPAGEKTTLIHLFGIKYADVLRGVSINFVAEQATGSDKYGTEIRKGIRLAKYVQLRDNLT